MRSDIKADIVEKYNQVAELFDEHGLVHVDGFLRVPEKKSSLFFVARKVEFALKLSKYKREMKAMEIGCSLGQMTILLAQHFNTLTAVDISPKCISITGEKIHKHGFTNVTFVVDDAEHLDSFYDDNYDRIYSFSTIRYCSDVRKAVNRVYNKLTKGGVAVVDFPNKYSPWHIFVKRILRIDKHVNDHLFTGRELRKMFEANGFREVEMKYMLFIPRMLPNRWFPLAKVLNNILERIPFINRLAGVIMIKGAK